MNAMQKMTEGMIKENQPKFEVGDTVRVSVRIKEGDKERIQAFEVPLLLRSMAASRRPSPSAAPLMVLALSVCSRSTARSSRTLRLFAAVRFPCQAVLSAQPHRQGRQSQGSRLIIGQYAAKGEDGWRSSLFVLSISMPGKGA